MRGRPLLLLWFAYLVFDLADPLFPGAFSFEVRDSEIEEAIHLQRYTADREVIADRSTPPERPVEPSEGSLTRQSLAVREQPPRNAAPPRPTPRSALLATAPSPDDH